ncbi:hypothetical protein I6B53_09805 [Schaalia sp. 19OD2882]|uniref:hypothetical protein n=1 Tax=Schaalia sp. 19OD2882 TaxID=2794089 RepID=UPI001C1EFC35|nr:hypothetical protein [Schaalia sp. 19OD2882]QWW19370.1 hypothetical protein I6B53_09805 [Schaalia sp. 19OD2882]
MTTEYPGIHADAWWRFRHVPGVDRETIRRAEDTRAQLRATPEGRMIEKALLVTIARGRKIDAVERLNRTLGCGMIEATMRLRALEVLARLEGELPGLDNYAPATGATVPAPDTSSPVGRVDEGEAAAKAQPRRILPPLERREADLVRQGEVLEAVRAYRRRTGAKIEDTGQILLRLKEL